MVKVHLAIIIGISILMIGINFNNLPVLLQQMDQTVTQLFCIQL